jgi:hypothetical protein
MDIKAKKINAMSSPSARIRRGRESPKNKALPGSEGDKSSPLRIKAATRAMKEL